MMMHLTQRMTITVVKNASVVRLRVIAYDDMTFHMQSTRSEERMLQGYSLLVTLLPHLPGTSTSKTTRTTVSHRYV